jgi:hypothetical protein
LIACRYDLRVRIVEGGRRERIQAVECALTVAVNRIRRRHSLHGRDVEQAVAYRRPLRDLARGEVMRPGAMCVLLRELCER